MNEDKTASVNDAQLLIQLYDLRREPVMRQARKYMVTEFWPQNYDEFKALMMDFGTERNAWARQCLSYWDMAAAMVLHGAVGEDLFFSCNIEPYFLFAKYGPYVSRFREEYISGDFLLNLEQVANRPKGKARMEQILVRLEARQKAAAAKTTGSGQ